MKKVRTWTLLSLLTLWLSVGCSVAHETETEANEPANDNIATEEAMPILETPVPSPTITESIQNLRLTPAATPQVEIVPTLEDSKAVIGEVPEEIMTAVLEDLSTTQGVLRDAMTVTRAEGIIWNDGSLGCPQPGEFYTQAPVNGYWIVLEANGRTYDYHAAENGYFFLCPNNLPPAPLVVGTPIS